MENLSDVNNDVNNKDRSNERGAVAVLFAIVLVVLLGFSALVVDIGQLFRVRNELQNLADSAAMAGARYIDGTQAGIDRARQRVNEYNELHRANSESLTLAAEDINFGRWHLGDNNVCSPAPCFQSFGPAPDSGDLWQINGVQVIGRRDAEHSVEMFFASFIGTDRAGVSAEAIAVGAGPYEECAFPLVVPDCQLRNPAADGSCLWCMYFQDANTDTAGWTGFAENGGCGTAKTQPINQNIIYSCGATGELMLDDRCTECNPQAQAGDTIQVCNGNMLNKNNFCETIQDILLRDGTGTARAFEVRIPVLESGLDASNCSAFNFSTTHNITGFATVQIFGALCDNNQDPNIYIDSAMANDCIELPPSGKYIAAKLLCDQESGGLGGGLPNATDSRPRLVR